MTTINQKNPSPNAPKLNTMMMDGNELKDEIESDYEELEFDDASAVATTWITLTQSNLNG